MQLCLIVTHHNRCSYTMVFILIILMAQRKIKLSETNRSILTRFPMHSANTFELIVAGNTC